MIDEFADLVAQQQIRNAMYRYCRALDRMDREVMATVFHPTATVHYPYFEGGWQAFVDYIWEVHGKAYDIHSHQMSNILIELAPEGGTATSESYVTATLWSGSEVGTSRIAEGMTIAGGPVENDDGICRVITARYLDSWSRREGRLAIDHRTCIMDLLVDTPAAGRLGEGLRNRADPSYKTASVFPAGLASDSPASTPSFNARSQ